MLSGVLTLDNLFFSALSPLLPHYVAQFSLSTTGAGVLVALDAVGGFIGVVPAALAVRRWGAKAVTLFGLLTVAASSVAFGLAPSIVALDLARLGQGLGSTFAWAAALTWLIAVAPAEDRARWIGVVLGSSAAGSLAGPALGTMAAYLGPAAVFGAVGVVCFLLSLVGVLVAAPPRVAYRQMLPRLAFAPRLSGILWLVTLPALVMAVLIVRAPLALSAAGASAAFIGAIFLATSGSEVLISPLLGHLADQYGRRPPLVLAAVATAVGASLFPWSGETLLLGLFTFVIGAGVLMFSAPALALLADEFERAHLPQEVGFALQSAAWAVGHMSGAFGAGAFGTTSWVPFVIVTGLCTATALLVLRLVPSDAGRALTP